MSHEPGRERHMQYHCEKCHGVSFDLVYRRHLDAYWCGSCIDNEGFDLQSAERNEHAPSK